VVRFVGFVFAGAPFFFAEVPFCVVAFDCAAVPFDGVAFGAALLRAGETGVLLTAFAFLGGTFAAAVLRGAAAAGGGGGVGDSTPGSSSDALWSAAGAPETAR
jgi:hypothetical protein